jgi:hypothetical protein
MRLKLMLGIMLQGHGKSLIIVTETLPEEV